MPDWYGNAALSFFAPLFSGEPSFPPIGSNFGFYNSPKTNTLIDQAHERQDQDDGGDPVGTRPTSRSWRTRAFFPITNPKHGQLPRHRRCNNAVYMPSLQNFDPTNIWLTPGKQGG